MKTHFLTPFKKAYKKRIESNKALVKRFDERYLLFIADPQNPILHDHTLIGTKQGFRSFSITGDIRVIYYIENNTAYFLDIGSHNQVY